ncbi:hypothetical protein BKA62DRAFT_297069 [Auriculariales sp. MPI-PUGE-AT-0066]|nr:hypothetical protein BKA62DRAFT_297069 [Auriculariales sp. MPI-PUGE-AT-0066]
MKSSLGPLTIQQLTDNQIVLLSRDSRIISVDYKFAQLRNVQIQLYSTPHILVSATVEEVDWLVVYGKPMVDNVYEIALVEPSECTASTGDFAISTQLQNSTWKIQGNFGGETGYPDKY